MPTIAARLGEVGLPEPISALASRHWDAIVVGGGHNGLTCAAYLARAGKSVLVLERRDRLGGACTLERPFPDERYVVSPCAYVVGLLDRVVIDELDLERRGLEVFVADPNLWAPFPGGGSFAQWLDDAKTQREPRRDGLSQHDIDGYWAYEHIFDEMRQRLRTRGRDTWIGESPTREEIEAMLGHDQWMIDILFDASIADVLDEYIDDQRMKDALYGQGVIGAYAGPRDWGTASVKLMHYQGDLDGQGPVWGYVKGGMGVISFAIAEAAEDAGAVLACGVPVAEILPSEGVRLEGGELIRATRRRVQRRSEACARDAAERRERARRVSSAAAGVAGPQPRREAQRRPHASPDLHRRRRRAMAVPVDGVGDAWPRRGAGRVQRMPIRSRRTSATARCTSRPATTRHPRRGQAPHERVRAVRPVPARRDHVGRRA